MKKFKQIVASAMAATLVASSMALSASADDITLKPGQAAAITSVIGASQVRYYGKCDSTSATSVTFRLRYASSSSLLTEAQFTLNPGGIKQETYSTVRASSTMWQYTASPSSGTNGKATGYAYAV